MSPTKLSNLSAYRLAKIIDDAISLPWAQSCPRREAQAFLEKPLSHVPTKVLIAPIKRLTMHGFPQRPTLDIIIL